jgi:4-hydroxybenzoate polyprenyltransferase
MTATLRSYLELVRFSHTIFALPFAVMAAAIAFAADPGRRTTAEWARMAAGVLLCMVAARTAAMAFNRLVDREIDARNPRTASRHLPSGAMTVGEVGQLVLISTAVFLLATLLFLPNWLPLLLAVPVLLWLLGYSYAKRFTPLAHLWLGVALGLAPVAAWIALRGEMVLAKPVDLLPAIVLGLSVSLWVAGFDVLYACQDAEFDVRAGLRSIPARYGVGAALRIAAALHLVSVILLAVLPSTVPALGPVYWTGMAGIAGLLIWEHALVRPDDLSRVNQAFFTANALIGVVLLAAILIDLAI